MKLKYDSSGLILAEGKIPTALSYRERLDNFVDN